MKPLCLALALLTLPPAARAEQVMMPGTTYEVRTPVTQPARVVFHPDSRVLIWEGDATLPTHEGNWHRRDGLFCIIEDPEFSPLCMTELARGDGAFGLVLDGRSMEFTPLVK